MQRCVPSLPPPKSGEGVDEEVLVGNISVDGQAPKAAGGVHRLKPSSNQDCWDLRMIFLFPNVKGRGKG